MFYSLLFLTALLSQLQGSSATAGSTQTRVVADGSGSIAGLNNLVVIGDGAASPKGDVSFSFYDYAVSSANAVTDNDFVQATSGTAANTLIAPAVGDLASNVFGGLGHAVAIADSFTVFVSQTSITAQTGRVVVYEGNVTSFKQSQLLIPYDGKHRMDSEAAFGESISAKPDALAVGCQNCNSSAPVFSGAVYVYKPNKEGRWSESQTLTAEGILFLGERVAMHDKVLVAAGDDASGPGDATTRRNLATSHDFSNIANTVVVFEEGHHGKFEQSQVITTKSGSFRESITGLTVFDETIAVTTMGTDLPGASSAATVDKVYIYYPMNKRYGLETKGKPSPKQQWTNIQILTTSDSAQVRWYAGEPHTSISRNSLNYLATITTTVALATSTRPCLSCKFETPSVTALAATLAKPVLLAADAHGTYGFNLAADTIINDPMGNTMFDKCLTIQLFDQFSDGWGDASLTVTDPNGRVDKFTAQCTNANPQNFKYCPNSQVPGKYHIHVEKGETPFGWEILWKVASGSSWYVGDRHTHMDFLWDDKYEDFHVGATKGLLPEHATCVVCDPNKPAGKHRSLSNLRSLHHKGTTSSPTISAAPTLVTTGQGNGKLWNQFDMPDATAWFKQDYSGVNFFISSRDGKHLFRSGTQCEAVASSCWVDIPDGDYTLRVGGVDQTSTLLYSFCEVSNDITVNSELQFTVLDQQCYAGLFTTVSNKCLTNYKSDWFLEVDLMLSGGTESLSSKDEFTLKTALSETLLSVLGSIPSSAQVKSQAVTKSGLKVSMLVEFAAVPDASAVTNLAKDSSSAGSLLKYELIGAQSLAANFLKGEVSGVTILAVSTDGSARDFSKVDESSFHTVTDHAWMTASVDAPSDTFNVYAKYVAEGAYALVAVAAVLAVSLFVKRAMAKTTAVEEDIQA